MKKSTWNIIKMHGWRLDRALHNYLYFVYYDLYVGYMLKSGRLLGNKLRNSRLLAAAFGMAFARYHSKVITKNDASKIFTLKQSLALGPDQTERIIPFQYANKIILQEPEFIAVMDCPCRVSREKHCQPVNLCIAVGRTTAEFWLEHGAKYHARKITQQEALQIIAGARERGNITTAWFKVATGGRTGVICSCCSCCCGGLETARIVRGLKHGAGLSIMAPSGYTIARDDSRCKACNNCVEVCMFRALIKVPGGKPVYDREACMGCGLCVDKCQQSARSFTADFPGLLPLDLDLAREKLL